MALSVGERLKSAREAKGIGMEEACRVTKIQRRILEGIEQDKVQEMLDPSYARIFLKKYASYLGADGPALMEEYLAAHGISSPASQSSGQPPQAGRGEPSDVRSLLVGVGAGLAALIGIGFIVYLGLELAGNLKESRRPPGAPAAEKPQQKAPASKPLLVPLAKKLELTIQASANVWLQVKADGSVVFQNVLPKGAKESWSAQKELELWTGNAGAMALTLNGKPLEGAGRGVKKGIRITHSGIEP